MNSTTQESPAPPQPNDSREIVSIEVPVDVKTAARFLGVSPSLVYAYVERKQIPHFRLSGCPPDSPYPKGLWFVARILVGVNDLAACDRIDGHSLLREAIEQFAPAL